MRQIKWKITMVATVICVVIGLQNSPHAYAASTPVAFQAECPPTIKCVVAPAAYQPNNGDVTNYGNYDLTNRPNDMKINSIVIHDTEGTLQQTLAEFKDPTAYVSAHYVIDKDGTVYQTVLTKDMAWHAGNWWVNMHSVGIEHVGYASDSTSYTPAMYWASSQLVKYLASKYHVPLDRTHIIAHDNVPSVSASGVTAMHNDPGPFWNWQNYMALLGAPTVPSSSINSGFVTVAPVWPLNKPQVTGCSNGTTSCVPQSSQPANFAYLRTAPNANAPLITDPLLGQGTTDINNNAARLFYGQKLAVAHQQLDKQGVWYQVWANGVSGWFYSPWSAPTAFPSTGQYATLKSGHTTPSGIYGRPSPETSAYPASLLATPPASFWIPTQAPQTPLPYTLAAGQRYSVIDPNPQNDHFYAWASDSSFPYDHTVFQGKTKYVEIQYGNRIGFVKASDVDIK